MIRNFAAIPGALLRPDRVFAGQAVYRVSKFVLLLMVFLVYVAGQRLSAGYDENAHAKELRVLEANAQMTTLMASAPVEAQRQAREQMLASILGQQSSTITAVTIVLRGVYFLLLFLELWLVCLVVTQFFGGQEERHGRDRPSQTLFLVAFIPLALRKLAAGIVLSFKNPDAAANAITFADYKTASAVRFDIFSLLFSQPIPAFIAFFARIVTDPFFLWMFAIVVFGGKEVFRMSLKSAVAQGFVLVLILSLQATLLKSIGISMEILT